LDFWWRERLTIVRLWNQRDKYLRGSGNVFNSF